METTELLKKVRKIEIKTKGLSAQIFSGEYQSAFKGRGMAFSEVREYQPGDPIRTIDWNVTARFNKPFIKVFEEEREMTVMLLVDVSASEDFGTSEQFKKDMITEISAVLSFSAITNNDKIGVILFSNQIELFIPPKKGRHHTLRIIRELINFKPAGKGTDIGLALKYFTNVIKKRSTCFVISDFQDANFEDPLKLANKKHDIVALRIFDQRDIDLPAIGIVQFEDPETGKTQLIDTSNPQVRNHFKAKAIEKKATDHDTFRKSGVDAVDISVQRSYVKPLMNLFKRREGKR